MENQQPLPNADVEISQDNGSMSTARNVPQPKVKGPRRRTKTGCLTCRKRRIKCGEEKPICNNCVRSKRECEGYAQRVIFRPPVGPLPYGNTPGAAAFAGMNRPMNVPFQQPQSQGGHPPIAPRPGQYGSDFYGGYMIQTVSPNDGTAMQHAMHFQQHQQQQPQQQPVAQGNLPPSTPVSDQQTPWGNAATHQYGRDSRQFQSAHSQGYSHSQGPTLQLNEEQAQNHPYQTQADQPSLLPTSYQFDDPNTQMSGAGDNHSQLQKIEHPLQSLPQSYLERLGTATVDPKTGMLVTYIEDEADDYFDVGTDDEGDETGMPDYSDSRSISMAMAVSQKHTRHQSRSSTAFVNDETILVSYRPSPFASPLMDPEVAKIFCHFIASVGPSLSIFERHPVNPSIMLSGVPVPPAQQSLFTYTLPTMALEHQGLLQTILALSSRHIASIKRMPLVASYKHYHYAIRRISKAVGLPNRRKQISTLAATLLLGFYEVMGGEHSKWNSHLGGATRLIYENDFVGMTRVIRSMRRKASEEQAARGHSGLWLGLGGPHVGSAFENDIFAQKESEVDSALVSTLMGQAIDYDSPGHVTDENPSMEEKTLTEKDVEEYRIRSDLYWWYCKQDLYQSLISGNRLLMPYSRWGQCPPRAAVGKLDAIYGTFDHYVLWAARIADFVVRDRKRKLKVIKANGGEWRPPPGFAPPGMGRGGPPGAQQGGGPPPASRGPPASSASTGRPGVKGKDTTPPMYGMMPAPSEVRLPSAFAEGGYQSAPSPSNSEDNDLDTETAQAEHEWNEIAAAGDELERAFGSGFAQLPPDGAPPISTPFGPALQYRTHTIACIWGYHYSAKIILERGHPTMPPQAMIAAGVAAQKTAPYAQLIGRIVAGIYYPQQYDFNVSNISPALSSVLTEVMLCLFFAGIQYTDPAQRGWTVAKLRDISRLTGGSTPSSIASGCETAWIAAYKAGKGPPYQRTANGPAYVDRGQGRVSESATNRRFLTKDQLSAVDLAMGLLSMEGDYENEVEEPEDTAAWDSSAA